MPCPYPRTVLIAALSVCLPAFAAVPAFAQAPQPAPPAAAEDAARADSAAANAAEAAEIDTLIRLLEDDGARARLIERLRAEGGPAAEEAVAADATVAGRLAEYTRDAAEAAAAFFVSMTGLVERVIEAGSDAATTNLEAVRDVVLGVALLVAATLAVFLALQLASRKASRVLAGAAADGDLVRRLKMTVASAVLDFATVVLAWSAGYVFALNIGAARQIGIDQSLFLNAFLIIELTKAGARTVLAPKWRALRPTRIGDTTAAYWYFWLSRLTSLIGYTFLFVAPILAAGVSADLAEALRILVLFTALAIAVTIILQNRAAVRARLTAPAAAGRAGPLARSLVTVGRTWHIGAIVYLVVVFALWLADPQTALPFVLTATGQTALAIVVGAALAAFIGRVASGGMRLPADVKERLPLLEERLNAFVPAVLRVVRAIVTLGVIVAILQAWRLADVSGWLSSEAGARFATSVISAMLILLGGGVVYLAMQSWVEYRLNPNRGRKASARERTLLSLFRNAFTIVLGVLVFMLVLAELGVNVGPLIAGAGVVGLAIGFGAQKLVQDIINGTFIQFENTMNEGDVVTAGGITGVVERLTIRSVSLRSLDGTYHLIPFSSVDSVSNFMKHFSYHLAAIRVAYRESIPQVKEAMQEAFERLRQTELGTDVLGDFEMHGVVELADSAVVVRGRIKTLPGQQWAVGRAYNEIVKQVFNERGIEIPFPHVTLNFTETAAGEAPLRIRDIDVQPAGGPAAPAAGTAPAAGSAAPAVSEAADPGALIREGDGDPSRAKPYL